MAMVKQFGTEKEKEKSRDNEKWKLNSSDILHKLHRKWIRIPNQEWVAGRKKIRNSKKKDTSPQLTFFFSFFWYWNSCQQTKTKLKIEMKKKLQFWFEQQGTKPGLNVDIVPTNQQDLRQEKKLFFWPQTITET